MILNDKQILDLAAEGMIAPYSQSSVKRRDGTGIMSYGVSSFGYDVRLSDEVKIFTNQHGALVDPKKLSSDTIVDARVLFDENGCKYVILPPNSYMLGSTIEYFVVPRNVMIVCVGKSTYARAGCLCNTTPIEPGFEGNVVIELSNGTSLPMKIYLDEGIAQFLFFQGDDCRISYADRNGKYMGQTGVTLPRV